MFIKIKFLKTLILISFITNCSSTKNLKLPIEVEIQTQKRIDLGYHLNTMIGVVDTKGMRFYSFGQMALDDPTKPDENSFFEISSITKPFTTALLADLELKNEIEINSSIEDYLPVFKQVLAQSDRTITLEDLINHTSGLPRNASNTRTEGANRYKDYTGIDLNSYLSQYTIKDSTRAYLYSSIAYLALEYAIENKMKISYESLLKERILKVLDMNDTYFVVPKGKRNRLVTPYRNQKHVDELDMGQFPAGGGLKATTKDMLRFLEAQLGIYPSNLDNALKLTHKERFSNKEEKLGLAWSIMKRQESGKTIIYHKGGSNGFVSFAGFNAEDQIGVVILASGFRYFSDLGLRILDPSYPLTIVKG